MNVYVVVLARVISRPCDLKIRTVEQDEKMIKLQIWDTVGRAVQDNH